MECGVFFLGLGEFVDYFVVCCVGEVGNFCEVGVVVVDVFCDDDVIYCCILSVGYVVCIVLVGTSCWRYLSFVWLGLCVEMVFCYFLFYGCVWMLGFL